MALSTEARAVSPVEAAVLTAQLEPTWFTQEILSNKDAAGKSLNDPWQDELLEAFQDLMRAQLGFPTRVNHQLKKRFAIRSGHGPGKTHFLAQLAHFAGFTRQVQIICIAPKEKLILTRLWPRFRQLYMQAAPAYRELLDIAASKVTWCQNPNWVMLPETAKDPVSLAGYHCNGSDDWVLVLVDEASGVREDFWPVIYGILSQPNTALFQIGNPTQIQGEFFRAHRDPKVSKHYYARHVKLGESRYQDKQWAEELREVYGEESPVYKIRVLGEFAEVQENQIIPLDWLSAARLREREPDGSHPKLRVSIDVADGGVCETVVTVALIYQSFTQLVKQKAFSFPPSQSPVMAADAAEQMFIAYGGQKNNSLGADDFVVDSIGVGAGTAGTLIERGYSVVTYKGGAESDDSTQWRNQRVQSYLVFRNGLRDNWIDIADDFVDSEREWDEFCAQTCAVRRKPGTERVEDVESKQDMMKRGVKSPDRTDSVVQICATKSPAIRRTMNSVLESVGDMMVAEANW